MRIQHMWTRLLIGLLVLVFVGCAAPVAQPAVNEASTAAGAPATVPSDGQEGIPAVAIFIADDFGQLMLWNYFTALSEQQITDQDNCLLTPAGQTFAARGAALDSSGRPHGEIVLETAQRYLEDERGAEVVDLAISTGSGAMVLKVGLLPQSVLTENGERAAVVIVPVPLPGFVTTNVANSLNAAKDELDNAIANRELYVTASDGMYQVDELVGIVLNMSFAIVPCDPSVVIPSLPSLQELADAKDGEQLWTGKVDGFLSGLDGSLIQAFTPDGIPVEQFQPDEGFSSSVPDLSPLDSYAHTDVMAALQDISEPAQITDFVSNPNGRSLTCMGRSISEYLNDVETEFRNFHDALNSSGTPDVFDEGNPEIVDATISMLGKAQLLAAYALGPALTLKNDPLKNFLSEAWWGIPVIQVAAAGNMECNYPFAPALWDGVVSVSANSGESYVFNKGEIIPNGDIKEGTSLAAPMVSVEEAVYLATTSTANCNGMSPPLNDDVWDNTALANADSKCPGFVR